MKKSIAILIHTLVVVVLLAIVHRIMETLSPTGVALGTYITQALACFLFLEHLNRLHSDRKSRKDPRSEG